ncbi:putative signal peptide-containing secreted protein [Cryptosporidium canis]|uniref:Signal peptide-containing secreted protein n=1 Tax=Cryptosporidium canis TaxID=195482 RepID=A0ABQ8P390_9CRYT|nr:putative signal peptide-containing secreted protein [Cryptosporidium canis]
MATLFKSAISALRASFLFQMLSTRTILTYILFWYFIPFVVIADSCNLEESKQGQSPSILNISNPTSANHTAQESPAPGLYNSRQGDLGAHVNGSNEWSKPDFNISLDGAQNQTYYNVVRGAPNDVLFNLKPKFANKLEDSSPSKCYIVSVSGGGAKGSFSSGLLNGLAFIYRYHGIKLRWDVASGVSIGSLATSWTQFYHLGQSAHFSTEGAASWKIFTHKNVHNCKSTLSKNAPMFIFRLINEGKRLPSYLCSTYPMLVYLRHLIQNRKRFKGVKWNALAYHYKNALPYFFNEEISRSLIPSVIRSSSSFPIVLEPTEIPGLGTFSDGGLKRAIDLHHSIHRCLQSGKAKSEKDIVIDIITTSYLSQEPAPVYDPEQSGTMLELISWFYYYYTFSQTYLQYEITQVIRRYPNIQFRHILSYADKEDSIVNRMGLMDFDNGVIQQSLNDGLESGFYNTTVYKDVWKQVDRNITPSKDWEPYGGHQLVIPNPSPQVSNPDSDAFIEFPTLEDLPYRPSPIFQFIASELRMLRSSQSAPRSSPETVDRETQAFFLELHKNILAIRFLENVREFIREREDDLLYIDEKKTELDRRRRSRANRPDRKNRLRPQHNLGANGGSGSEEYPNNTCRDSIISKPFFRASRHQLGTVSEGFAYSEAVRARFINNHTNLKYNKLVREEKKVRRPLAAAHARFIEKKRELEELYEEYDSLMAPLNRVYSSMLQLTASCGPDSGKIPIMFPFLEGEDSKNLIWAPAEEYEALNVGFKKSTLELLSEMYPSVDWFSRLPERLPERPSRIRNWNLYKKGLLSHLRYSQGEEILCWARNPDMMKIISEIKELTTDISSLKVKHFELMTEITNAQLVIPLLGVISKYYSASVELLFRKNFARNLLEVEDIFHKTSHTKNGPELSNEHLSGFTSEEEIQTIREEALRKMGNIEAKAPIDQP